MTVGTLRRSLLDLGSRLPQPSPELPDGAEPSPFEWLEDDELVRCEELFALIDDVGKGTPAALEAEAELVLWMARGEARRAAGKPTVIEEHLASFPPRR